MEIINIWETSFGNRYEYLNNIKDLFQLIEPRDFNNIEVKDKYLPDETPESILEARYQKRNQGLNYINDNHSILVEKEPLFFSKNIIISTKEFEKSKDYIITEMGKRTIEYIEQQHPRFIIIDALYFSDELLDVALANCNSVTINDVDLTDEQLQKIKDSYIDVYLEKNRNKELINDSRLLNEYTKKDLEEKEKFSLDISELSLEELKNIKFIKDNVKVSLLASHNEIYDDAYYQKCFEVLKTFKELGKNVNVDFRIGTRYGLSKYIPELEKYTDYNLKVICDANFYTIEEYIHENEKFDKLVRDIRDSSLSPFEKYLAVYNIVKKFKPYKENDEDLNQSRDIRYIIDNEYIVCAGYSNLLVELLERVGIESSYYNTSVYGIENDKSKYLGGHARTIVNLKDEKYNIDGYYIADATWDNNDNIGDTYDFALRTFDSMQKSSLMFELTETDYILDNHNFEEFVQKVNVLLDKKIKNQMKKEYNKNDFKKCLLEAYSEIYNDIVIFFRKNDKNGYNKILPYIQKKNFKVDESFYVQFLTEVGHYIVNKSNKEIDFETLSKASANAKYYKEDVPDVLKEAYSEFVKKELVKNNSEYFIQWESKEEKEKFERLIAQNQIYFMENPLNLEAAGVSLSQEKNDNTLVLKPKSSQGRGGFISISIIISLIVITISVVSLITYYLITR